MVILFYDKSFEGFLSCIFFSYSNQIIPNKILDENFYQSELFAQKHKIISDPRKAKRVWDGIRKKTSKHTQNIIYKAFLSELPEIEILLFHFIQLIFNTLYNVETDFSNPQILEVHKIFKKVNQEIHRAMMFLRFQKTKDNIYFSSLAPLYNIIPLCINHFRDRFRDQQWVIYDTKRKFGFYFDLKEVTKIHFTNTYTDISKGLLDQSVLDIEEIFYQKLWKEYYNSTNIKERKNMKLHKQLLPKRFWIYLPEKN